MRLAYADPPYPGNAKKHYSDPGGLMPCWRRAAGRVPVEIKSGAAPDQPHASHVLQLMAYCRLVHATYGRRPPYGILKYADGAFEVPYSRQAEAELRRAVNSMHALGADLPDRSHRDPARCAACGFVAACDQRLAPAEGGWL